VAKAGGGLERRPVGGGDAFYTFLFLRKIIFMIPFSLSLQAKVAT
jgi:hypothetical protein